MHFNTGIQFSLTPICTSAAGDSVCVSCARANAAGINLWWLAERASACSKSQRRQLLCRIFTKNGAET